jgi:hypothetical protein
LLLTTLISLPHKVSDSECYVNGIEDILAWKGRKYADHLLSVVGGMASFAYLKFKSFKPPNMVFWGTNTKYFVPNLEKIIGFEQIVTEGRSTSASISKLEESITQGTPVMAGALDMYYLPYYPKIYRTRHIPIHYLLVVGYDEVKRIFFVHDCGRSGVQEIPYENLRRALDVKVPGMSKKNTLRVFRIPKRPPTELEVARKGFILKAKQMLHPPVSMSGIPAMRKLSREVLGWKDRGSFEHMVTYATSPPALPQDFRNSHGMRLWQAKVLRELSRKYDLRAWGEASKLFEQSGRLIIQLCEAAMAQKREDVAGLLARIADLEQNAYTTLEYPSSLVSRSR